MSYLQYTSRSRFIPALLTLAIVVKAAFFWYPLKFLMGPGAFSLLAMAGAQFWLSLVFGLLFLGAQLVTLAGLRARRSWALWASGFFALVMLSTPLFLIGLAIGYCLLPDAVADRVSGSVREEIRAMRKG